MNVERISSRQLAWLIITINISTPTMLMPMIVISYAKQNAWLSMLLATLAAAVGILINTALAGKFPGQSISQYAQTLLGTWLGKALGIFYGVSSLYIGAISAVRSFSQIFEVAVMPETPLWVFVVILTVLGIYTARQGIEPVARANDLVLPFTLLVLLVLLLLALLLSAWLTVTAIKFAVFIYCFAIATSYALGRKNYRPLLLVGIIPVLAIALGPISLAEQMRIWIISFLFDLIVPLTFFILPVFLLCIAKVRQRHV